MHAPPIAPPVDKLNAVLNGAKGILEKALGVSITNTGTYKQARYCIVGFHEWPVPRFKSGKAKKVKFKPPIWDITRGRIVTR